jgi:hypothetical protein
MIAMQFGERKLRNYNNNIFLGRRMEYINTRPLTLIVHRI